MSKVSGSEQPPATSQWCHLCNMHSKSSAGMMYQNCRKTPKPTQMNLISLFLLFPLPVLPQFLGVWMLWGSHPQSRLGRAELRMAPDEAVGRE